jgi:hypothetical protein
MRGCCSKPTLRFGRFASGQPFWRAGAGRVLDFCVDHGGHSKFWAPSSEDSESESLPRTAHGVSLRVLRRPDTIAFAMRIQNWAQIVPSRISFLRHSEPCLQKDIVARLEKPHRLERIEAGFHPIDTSVARAAFFDLPADGKVTAPDLDSAPLGLNAVFRRSTP